MSKLRIDDAIDFLVRHLAEKFGPSSASPATTIQCARQYDIEIQHVARAYWLPRGHDTLAASQGQLEPFSRPFSDAAWYLCRIGVLRPGEKEPFQGIRGPAWDGGGFSLTQFGREWVVSDVRRPPLEPDRFGEVMQPLAGRFGPGFLQRALEAASCYRTANYLACCAMTGASAESILLAVAIVKLGDAKAILNQYRGASGRRSVLNRVTPGTSSGLHQQFETAFNTLGFWRDETTHGIHSSVGEVEAFMSLGQLLRLAQLSHDNWEVLTA